MAVGGAPYPRSVRDREHPRAADYERELAATVGSSTDRWLTEIRLAVIGIVISVGLGVADIALALSGWEVALVVGVGSTLVFVALLWRLRPQAPARGESFDDDLHRLDQELTDLRAAVDTERNPARELLEAWAAEAEKLSEHADRIAEEAYLTTDEGGVLRRLRDYDARLHELAAEIRCRDLTDR